jgi:hypothetical protein
MKKLTLLMLAGLFSSTVMAQGTPPPAKKDQKPAATPASNTKPADKPADKPAATDAKAGKDAKPAEASFAPPKPGPETTALAPFAANLAYSGTTKPGAMGPGSPEVPSKGTHKCKWTLDKLWLDCDIVDVSGTGKQAMTWKGHIILGWDFEAKAYHALVADSFGGSQLLSGKLGEDKKLVMTTVGDVTMMGQPFKYRITYDLSDPKAIKFTDERLIGKEKDWMLAEEAVMKPGK